MVAADILQQYYPWKFYTSNLQAVHNYNLYDNVTLFYPMRFYAKEMLKKGEIPFWDPYIFCGVPFFANYQSAIFSPFSIIFYLFPTAKAFGYSNVVLLFLAGLFMFLFMKAIKVGFFGSFVSSLVFMFNGFFIVWLGADQNMVSVGLWLPLILLFIERMFQEQERFFFVVLTGVIIALQFLSGEMQISLYVLLAVIIYAVIRMFQLYPHREKRTERMRCFSLLGIACIIGFGLASIQLIPSYELVSISNRIGELYKYKFQLIDLSSLLHLITFIFPNIYGNPTDNNYWGALNYVELCGYIGILPFLLAILAVSRWKDRINIPFLTIAIFALLVYLRTPLLSLLYLVPGYSRTLSVSRIIFLYTFSASVLAGLGANYLDKREDLKSKVKVLNKFTIKCLFIATCIFLLGNLTLQIGRDYIISRGRNIINLPFCSEPNFGIMVQTFFKSFSISYAKYLEYYHLFSPTIYVPFFLVILIICVFSLYLKKKASLIFKTILCLIILVDLFYFGMRYLTMVEPKIIYPEVEAVKFLKKDSGIWRAISLKNAFPSNTLIPYKIQSADGVWSLCLKRYIEFMFLVDKDAISQPDITYIRLHNYNSKLLNLLNVKYILTTSEIVEKKYKLVYNKDILVYENTEFLPRAFVVPRAVVIKEKIEIFRHLSSNDFVPSEYVILEEEPNVKPSRFSPPSLPRMTEVNIAKYSSHLVSIEANLSNNGFLVLSDSYYPGWRVYVNGKESKLFCVNYIMRGVYLDKGYSKVDFIYDPVSFKVGKYISLSTLMLVTLFLGVYLVTRLKLKYNDPREPKCPLC